jgi:AcrR family transcriptional regulator
VAEVHPSRRGRPRSFEDAQVFQITTRILIEGGLESLTLQRIAADLGVSHQAIAQRFVSKVGLLEAYFGWYSEIVGAAQRTMRATFTSPLELIRAYLVQPLSPELVGREWNNPNVGWIIILLELQREPALTEIVHAQNRRGTRMLGDLFAAAQDAGELREGDPYWIAELALATVTGAVVQWLFHHTGDISAKLSRCRDAVLAPYVVAHPTS